MRKPCTECGRPTALWRPGSDPIVPAVSEGRGVMAVQDPGERFGAVWPNPHAEDRWAERADADAQDLLVRWAEAEPVDAPQAPEPGADARAHVPTDTLLIARYGQIVTVLDIAACPDHAERQIRRQL